VRLIGLDPGLRHTGWGVVDMDRGHLAFVACGRVSPPPGDSIALRLRAIHDGLAAVLQRHAPDSAAIEETFMNRNPAAALKLGHARGAAILAAAVHGLEVASYSARSVKQAVTGAGGAGKEQVAAMVRVLLPGCGAVDADAADALAVAVCHGHSLDTARRIAGVPAAAGMPGAGR